MTRIEVPNTPGYHLMTDLANQAIKWTSAQKSLTPDKPFFTYFAPGATHAPHHAPTEWIAKYKGKFDQSWDKVREGTIEVKEMSTATADAAEKAQRQVALKVG